ncbi:MAG: class I SAM-dependent methyltransferase [Candidatus Bathyarchaeia archaeon]
MYNSGIPKTDYSKIARHYDRFRMSDVDYWLSKIIEYGKIEQKCAVLDVGCGTGRFSISLFVAKNCLLYALDLSIDMLKQALAKDKSKRILWIRGDGQRLPFRDSVFDCVYMTLVIHHIEDKKLALQEIHRVLKKNGKCVIMTNSHARIKKHVLRYFPGVLAIDLKRFPTIPSLKRMMKMVDFKDVHYHILRYDRGYISTKEYLKRVKNKYISTLTLLSEDSFQKGFKFFRDRVKRKYGNWIKQIDNFVFVVGQK